MRAKARLFGHPIHQMLIVFPLGLLATAVLFDFVWLVRDRPGWAASSVRYTWAASRAWSRTRSGADAGVRPKGWVVLMVSTPLVAVLVTCSAGAGWRCG